MYWSVIQDLESGHLHSDYSSATFCHITRGIHFCICETGVIKVSTSMNIDRVLFQALDLKSFTPINSGM